MISSSQSCVATGLLVHLGLMSFSVTRKAQLWTVVDLLTPSILEYLVGKTTNDDRKVMSLRRTGISESDSSFPCGLSAEVEMLLMYLILLLCCSCVLCISFCIYFPVQCP